MSKTVPKSNARSTKQVALAQKNKKNTNSRKAKRRTNRRGNPIQRPGVHLSACTRDYAAAKLRPFENTENIAPCIPDLLDLPSQKFQCGIKGEAAVGTAGYGFITVAPYVNCNDEPAVAYSLPTYPDAYIPFNINAPGVQKTVLARYPWGQSNKRLVRTVACGLRVRYTGTELNRGGRVVLAQISGDGQDSFVNQSITDLLSAPEVRSYPVTRSWKTISLNPGYPKAFEYHEQVYGLASGATSTMSNGRMAAFFTGTATNVFEFEVIYYYEGITNGANLVNGVSKSHSDPVGLGLVKDYMGGIASGVIESNSFQNFLTFAGRGAAAAATTYFTGSPSLSVPLIEYL